MARAVTDTRETILIVEKDAHTAYLLEYMLSREGFKVIYTSECDSACIMLQTMLAPSMIFLDLNLCLENNYAFLRRVRGMPGWQTTPVIILSENYTYQDIDPALAAGATDYIILPFNPAELMGHVHRHKPGFSH